MKCGPDSDVFNAHLKQTRIYIWNPWIVNCEKSGNVNQACCPNLRGVDSNLNIKKGCTGPPVSDQTDFHQAFCKKIIEKIFFLRFWRISSSRRSTLAEKIMLASRSLRLTQSRLFKITLTLNQQVYNVKYLNDYLGLDCIHLLQIRTNEGNLQWAGVPFYSPVLFACPNPPSHLAQMCSGYLLPGWN